MDWKHWPKIDAWATSHVIGQARVAENINDVRDLVLSPHYKFVLLLKEDSMNTHCDFLLILTIMLLFLAMRTTVLSMFRLNLYFQRMCIAFLRTYIFTKIQSEEKLLQFWLAFMQIWDRNNESSVEVFMDHSVVWNSWPEQLRDSAVVRASDVY